MKVPNLKGLGKNQQQTVKFLEEGCVLVHVQYYSDHTQIFSIEDKFDVFKEISLIEFNSLVERNIIYSFSSIERTVNVTNTVYKLNPAVFVN